MYLLYSVGLLKYEQDMSMISVIQAKRLITSIQIPANLYAAIRLFHNAADSPFQAVLMGLDHNGLLTTSISTINALLAQDAREEPARPTFTGTHKPVNLWSQGTLSISVVAVYMCGYGPKSTLAIYRHSHLLSSFSSICHHGNVNTRDEVLLRPGRFCLERV